MAPLGHQAMQAAARARRAVRRRVAPHARQVRVDVAGAPALASRPPTASMSFGGCLRTVLSHATTLPRPSRSHPRACNSSWLSSAAQSRRSPIPSSAGGSCGASRTAGIVQPPGSQRASAVAEGRSGLLVESHPLRGSVRRSSSYAFGEITSSARSHRVNVLGARHARQASVKRTLCGTDARRAGRRDAL